MSPTDTPKDNAEIRRWYLEKVSQIPDLNQAWIADGRDVIWRAREAWRVRHEARQQARLMMQDLAEVELLRARDIAKYGNPEGPTFDFLLTKLGSIGLEGDAIYEAIVDNSYRTDAELNQKLGL